LFAYRGPATLDGLHRVEGRYPTLAPGGTTTGRLLATDEIGALDRYEGVAEGLYVRVSVPVEAESGTDDAPADTAAVYVGDPARLDADADWPGEGPFPERVRTFVKDGDATVVLGREETFADFEGYAGDIPTDAATDHDDWGVE
jgi:hypothetical protein